MERKGSSNLWYIPDKKVSHASFKEVLELLEIALTAVSIIEFCFLSFFSYLDKDQNDGTAISVASVFFPRLKVISLLL